MINTKIVYAHINMFHIMLIDTAFRPEAIQMGIDKWVLINMVTTTKLWKKGIILCEINPFSPTVQNQYLCKQCRSRYGSSSGLTLFVIQLLFFVLFFVWNPYLCN